MNSLGMRIKEIRKNHKLTQSEFGDRISLSTSSVSMVEKNKQGISDSVEKHIIENFCINEEWLRNGTGEMYSSTRIKEQEELEKYREFILEYSITSDLLKFLETLKDCGEEAKTLIQSGLWVFIILYNAQNKSTAYFESLTNFLFTVKRFIEYLEDVKKQNDIDVSSLDVVSESYIKELTYDLHNLKDVYLNISSDNTKPSNVLTTSERSIDGMMTTDLTITQIELLEEYNQLTERDQLIMLGEIKMLAKMTNSKKAKSSNYQTTGKKSPIDGEEAATKEVS